MNGLLPALSGLLDTLDITFDSDGMQDDNFPVVGSPIAFSLDAKMTCSSVMPMTTHMTSPCVFNLRISDLYDRIHSIIHTMSSLHI